jgi:hypothetical protein
MGVDRKVLLVTRLVKDRLLGCMGISGKGRSQGWDEHQG